jgi:hypothetical protein
MPWHTSFVLSGIVATEHLFDNWSDTIERGLPDRMCKFASRARAALAGSPRVQASSTRHVRGCATPTGSAGHAGVTASPKLTFQLDHPAGADQPDNQVKMSDFVQSVSRSL